MTATELRKNLFSALEAALDGETVEFTYKGTTFSLTPNRAPSRLDSLEPFPYILTSDDDLVETRDEFWNEEEWLKKWDRRLSG